MTSPAPSQHPGPSRREFLQGTGALVVGFALAGVSSPAGGVAPDGTIRLTAHPSRKVSYAALIGDKSFGLKSDDKAPLIAPAKFKIIGQPVRREDIPDKVTGRFTYMQDVRLPGMLHARTIRPP